MNSKKIEMGAILKIKDIICYHDFMEEYINSNDKEPSWDGHIYVYKSKDLKVENILHRIPVQVKGKNDKKLLNRKFISYDVEYKYLRNYYKDGGVFFIVVVLSDDGKKRTLFYNPLTTIKIADLLKGKENKKPDNTKSIHLLRLEEDFSDNLYKLLLQFGMDRENQGSGNCEIVKKAISMDVMDRVDCIKATSYFAQSEDDIIKEIVTGGISLYGHRADLDMWLPFDYAHQKSIVFKKVIKLDKAIGIGDKNYYDCYYVERTSEEDDRPIIKVSENLTLDFYGGKINLELKGDIKSLMRDVEFLKAIKVGETFRVNNKNIQEITEVKIPKELQEKMQMISDFNSALKEIGVEIDKKFVDFTKENNVSVVQLVNIYRRQIVPEDGKEHAWYMWYWDEKLVPIFLGVEEEQLEVVNWFTTQEYEVFITKDDVKYTVPNYVLFKREILEKLYDVEESIWVKEIEKLENIEQIKDALSECFIELLAAYDVTHNEKYYNTSKLIMEKILDKCSDDEYSVINMLQLVKRKGAFTEEQIIKLEEIEENTDNPNSKCAVNILLENKRQAQKILSSLSEAEQKDFKRYPIYNLL